MKSMTGYGSSQVDSESGAISVEVKAVNHRFLECQVRMPHGHLMLENSIRKLVKKYVSRGKIELFIQVDNQNEKTKELQVDEELLDQYVSIAKEIEAKLGCISLPLDVNQLLKNDYLVQVVEKGEGHLDEQAVLYAVEQALTSLNEMREKEGALLLTEMEKWICSLRYCCDEIDQLIPTLVITYKEKLETRIRSLIQGEMETDDNRILTEVALFAEKIDVEEEIVRMRSHIKQFEIYFENGGEIGRKLDFLIQEMNRELNTIGSKVGDSKVRQHVVEMKGMVEKLKEQVQNIE